MRRNRETELDKVKVGAAWRGSMGSKEVDALITVEGRGTNAIPGLERS